MTPLNPSTYNWTSLLPGIYRRPALSTEALWSAKPKELHEIFATAKLRLVAARTPRVLKPAALRAWRLLRFEVPELGVRAVVQDGEVFLEYKGIDEGEIQEWISRTCFVNEEGEGVYDFEALRRDICSKKDDDEQASVLLNFLTRDGLVENISMVLNTDHQITDGIGTRILLGRFLDLFSWCIGLKSEDVLTWEESDKNLSKPWIGMLDGKQKLEGKDFEEVVEKKRNYLYHEIVTTSPFLFSGSYLLAKIYNFISRFQSSLTNIHTHSPRKPIPRSPSNKQPPSNQRTQTSQYKKYTSTPTPPKKQPPSSTQQKPSTNQQT